MNIVLVGMPGAGKSTIGVVLAKELAYDFVDTDISIQHKTGETLQETMDRDGYLKLRQIEEEVLLELDLKKTIISTGGSAVYGDSGMTHLKKSSIIVFIRTELDELKRRVTNYENRGIARRADQSFKELFDERELLYNKYSDIVVESLPGNQDEMVLDIVNSLESKGVQLNNV